MNTILIFLLLAPLFGGGAFYSRAYAVAGPGPYARRGRARAPAP